jgi:hypothetical protein
MGAPPEGADASDPDERHETPLERADRHLGELLQGLLIAPTVHHRHEFRRRARERMMFGRGAGLAATASVALVFTWIWYGIPLARRRGDDRSRRPPD